MRRGPHPRTSGTDVLVGASLLVSIASAVALVVVYASGGDVQVEGVLLAGALGGIAVAVGLWVTRFMPSGDAVQDRPPLASSPEDRAELVREIDRGGRSVTRRRVLTGLLVSAVGALGAAALVPLRSLGPPDLPSLRTTAWRPGRRLVDEDGAPVRVDRLDLNGVLTVFPEGATEQEREHAQTLLLRVGETITSDRAASEVIAGHIAFSKLCTHAGCPVGLYQVETHQLVCPCHQSLFDVTDGARPVFGPATRSLPPLPLRVDDEVLVADADFPDPPGAAFWTWGRS